MSNHTRRGRPDTSGETCFSLVLKRSAGVVDMSSVDLPIQTGFSLTFKWEFRPDEITFATL